VLGWRGASVGGVMSAVMALNTLQHHVVHLCQPIRIEVIETLTRMLIVNFCAALISSRRRVFVM
jgi:esterase/lipase